MIPAHRPSWIFGDIYTPQDVPESLQFGWRLTTCYGGTPMILTLGKYNKHNNMNYIENIQGIPPFADRFSYGVTIRSPTSHWFSAIEKPPCHSGKKKRSARGSPCTSIPFTLGYQSQTVFSQVPPVAWNSLLPASRPSSSWKLMWGNPMTHSHQCHAFLQGLIKG